MPYRFVGKTVDLKITDSVIEIYYGHERISSHKRFPSYVRNRYDTYPGDIPERFQKTEWNELTLRSHLRAILAAGQDVEYKENKKMESESSPAGFVRGAAYYGGDDHAE